MTDSEKLLVRKLVLNFPINKFDGKYTSQLKSFDKLKSEFRKKFTVDIVGQPAYLISLFESSYDKRAGDDVELLMSVTRIFNLYSISFVEVLTKILSAPWHHCHENIVDVLSELKSPECIDSIFLASRQHYKYLDFDCGHSTFVIKCIWALGEINTPEALSKIKQIADDTTDEIVRERAIMQLHGDKGAML